MKKGRYPNKWITPPNFQKLSTLLSRESAVLKTTPSSRINSNHSFNPKEIKT